MGLMRLWGIIADNPDKKRYPNNRPSQRHRKKHLLLISYLRHRDNILQIFLNNPKIRNWQLKRLNKTVLSAYGETGW